VVISIEFRLERDKQHFQKALFQFKNLIRGKRVGIWDTESDGRGGTHTLS
jgi:hypothetical protein